MLDSEGRGAAVSQGWAGTPFLPPFSCSGSRTSRVLRTLALSRCFCSTTDGMEGEHSFIRLPVSGNAYKSSHGSRRTGKAAFHAEQPRQLVTARVKARRMASAPSSPVSGSTAAAFE